jgi:hypothetical protein
MLLLPAFGYRRRPGGDERDGGNEHGYGDADGGAPTRIRDVRSLVGGLAASAAGLAAVLAATGWWRDVGGFLGAQQARGLQLEAVPATPFVLARILGVGGAPAYEFGSMQFSSGAAQAVASACSLAGLGIVVAGTVWWWGMGRTLESSAADRALALLALVVVTARVLSPQYLIWLFAVAACRPAPWAGATAGRAGICADTGRSARRHQCPALLLLAIAFLSQMVYPTTYDGLVAGEILPSLLLVARNAVLVALCLILIRSAVSPRRRRLTPDGGTDRRRRVARRPRVPAEPQPQPQPQNTDDLQPFSQWPAPPGRRYQASFPHDSTELTI